MERIVSTVRYYYGDLQYLLPSLEEFSGPEEGCSIERLSAMPLPPSWPLTNAKIEI